MDCRVKTEHTQKYTNILVHSQHSLSTFILHSLAANLAYEISVSLSLSLSASSEETELLKFCVEALLKTFTSFSFLCHLHANIACVKIAARHNCNC